MPVVELPNGQSATLYENTEITQLADEEIGHAYMVAAGAVAKLETSGFVENDPKTWGALASLEPGAVNSFEAVLITHMVKSYSGEMPDNPKLLPAPVFKALAAACNAEYQKTADLSPDALANDPKAPPADSPA